MRAADRPSGDDVGHDGLVEPLGAFGGGGHDHGVEVAGQVGSAGGGVVVGRVVEGLDGDLDAPRRCRCPGRYRFLSGGLREERARADRVEAGLRVDAAGDVEAVDLAGFGGSRARRGRSLRTGARRRGPGARCRGCRAAWWRGGWPCRRGEAGRPRSSRSARVRAGRASPARCRARPCPRCRRASSRRRGRPSRCRGWRCSCPWSRGGRRP